MERNKITCQARSELIDVDKLSDVGTWLRDRAAEYGLRWLLAHGEDGVMWGRFENGRLITSHEAAAGSDKSQYCPALRTELLHQARLFSESAEVLLWRDGDGDFRARLIREAQPAELATWTAAFDEAQMLLGTDAVPLNEDFTLMSDGAEGLRHAVPIKVAGKFDENSRPLRLTVRNYMKEDETGFVRVAASRLVKVEVGK